MREFYFMGAGLLLILLLFLLLVRWQKSHLTQRQITVFGHPVVLIRYLPALLIVMLVFGSGAYVSAFPLHHPEQLQVEIAVPAEDEPQLPLESITNTTQGIPQELLEAETRLPLYGNLTEELQALLETYYREPHQDYPRSDDVTYLTHAVWQDQLIVLHTFRIGSYDTGQLSLLRVVMGEEGWQADTWLTQSSLPQRLPALYTLTAQAYDADGARIHIVFGLSEEAETIDLHYEDGQNYQPTLQNGAFLQIRADRTRSVRLQSAEGYQGRQLLAESDYRGVEDFVYAYCLERAENRNTYDGSSVYNNDLEEWVEQPAQTAILDQYVGGLYPVCSYRIQDESMIEAWRFIYWLLPEEPDKFLLAGGMQVREDGWIGGFDMGGYRNLLLIRAEDGSFEHLADFVLEWQGDSYLWLREALIDIGLDDVVQTVAQDGIAFNPLYLEASYQTGSTRAGGQLEPEVAAYRLLQQFIEDASQDLNSYQPRGEWQERTFQLTQTELQGLELWATAELDPEGEIASRYALRARELGEQTWLVEPKLSFQYEGLLEPFGLRSRYNTSGLTRITYNSLSPEESIGLLMRLENGIYSLTPRGPQLESADNL